MENRFPRQEFDSSSSQQQITNINDEMASQNQQQSFQDTNNKPQQAQSGFLGQLPIDQAEIQQWLQSGVNTRLIVPKAFYFFFFSAFGSLFPLMAIYFKQLGMNAVQTAILIGIRPFIEFISAPFWSGLADRYRKCKVILLVSLFCWIIFTCALAYIRPPASACVTYNATHHILYTPYSSFDTNKKNQEEDNDSPVKEERWEEGEEEEGEEDKWATGQQPKQQTHHSPPPNYVVGKSPLTVDYTLNYNQEKHTSYVSPAFSSIVYKLDDVREVFFLLLLLIILGEFFSAPAITLADSATLTILGESAGDDYGKQRMFGSVGWGITMLFVGMALDHSTKFKDHPCGPHPGERNYRTCFSIFAFLMGCSFVAATQFHFKYDESAYADATNGPVEGMNQNPNEIPMKPYNGPGPRPIFNPAPPINRPPGGPQERKFEFIDKWKSAVFAQRTRELPEWMTVLRSFASVKYGMFLFVTWFLGFGIGLVFTFLFWHLQDLGGTPTLYGLASVINHISEIGAFFFSINFIKQYGHTRILCVGLAANVLRFLYISWIGNPWFVLPFELIQGITHAACYAACCSYINHITYDMPELRSSAQGVLQGLHHGLGRGCGAIIGGIFVTRWGSSVTFRLYGAFSILVLAAFAHVNFYRKGEGYGFFDDVERDLERLKPDDLSLAPHGVPSGPTSMGRTHRSDHNLENYGGDATNAMLQQQQENVATNPFLTEVADDSIYLEPSHQWGPRYGATNESEDTSLTMTTSIPQQPVQEQQGYNW